MVNRLASETSPYLLQHAHNPVDWFPWGSEALERARAEDRPVFLSVGYAACHWCHVMERESFEHAPTAAFLNRHFVSVKVDREERPDIDAIYMLAVQAMTGQGGWPMSVFLTPDGRPFFGGTYFPGDRRYGMPSFRDVLESVASAWRERRTEVEASADRLAAMIGAPPVRERAAAMAGRAPAPANDGAGRRAPVAVPVLADAERLADRAVLDDAVATLAGSFDATNGGWGGAPKFPQPATIEFLLARAVAGDEPALRMARRTLDRMADGGVFDHVGGGFHRYATDAAWLVPHFEKMLYDNAQLARVYLHAHQLTGETRYRAVAEATLDWMLGDLATPEGAFASSLDADTNGTEGATYTWTYDEIDDLLGPDDGSLFASAFGVLAAGNWEGRTILSRVRSDAEVAATLGVAVEEVGARLAGATRTLLAVRGTRPQPRRDDKVIAAWNGLALAAFADAARILGRDEYLDVALRLAEVLLATLRAGDGRMRRSWKDGRASQAGFLEDQAALADGLLALYGVTFDERWFRAARELADATIEHYAAAGGGFFDTPDDHEDLLLRPRSLEDGATPSGSSMTATALIRLGALTGEGRYAAAIDGAFRLVREHLARYPTAFANWLVALDLVLAPLREIAIVGDPAEDDTQALLDVVLGPYRPHQVLALTPDPASSTIELLQSRFALGGRPTAFVCRDFACRQPVNEPQALAAQLAT